MYSIRNIIVSIIENELKQTWCFHFHISMNRLYFPNLPGDSVQLTRKQVQSSSDGIQKHLCFGFETNVYPFV